ncbi:MAG: hypothetical protein KDD42_00080 [Bdellovibrionales bacterium]|nr:hypothetical protein [Bdellovibrionales bacterium]
MEISLQLKGKAPCEIKVVIPKKGVFQIGDKDTLPWYESAAHVAVAGSKQRLELGGERDQQFLSQQSKAHCFFSISKARHSFEVSHRSLLSSDLTTKSRSTHSREGESAPEDLLPKGSFGASLIPQSDFLLAIFSQVTPLCKSCLGVTKRIELRSQIERFLNFQGGHILIGVPLADCVRKQTQIRLNDLAEVIGAERLVIQGKLQKIREVSASESFTDLVLNRDAQAWLVVNSFRLSREKAGSNRIERVIEEVLERHSGSAMIGWQSAPQAEILSIAAAPGFACEKCNKFSPRFSFEELQKEPRAFSIGDVALGALAQQSLQSFSYIISQITPGAASSSREWELLRCALSYFVDLGFGSYSLEHPKAEFCVSELLRIKLAQLLALEVCDCVIFIPSLLELLTQEEQVLVIRALERISTSSNTCCILSHRKLDAVPELPPLNLLPQDLDALSPIELPEGFGEEYDIGSGSLEINQISLRYIKIGELEIRHPALLAVKGSGWNSPPQLLEQVFARIDTKQHPAFKVARFRELTTITESPYSHVILQSFSDQVAPRSLAELLGLSDALGEIVANLPQGRKLGLDKKAASRLLCGSGLHPRGDGKLDLGEGWSLHMLSTSPLHSLSGLLPLPPSLKWRICYLVSLGFGEFTLGQQLNQNLSLNLLQKIKLYCSLESALRFHETQPGHRSWLVLDQPFVGLSEVESQMNLELMRFLVRQGDMVIYSSNSHEMLKSANSIIDLDCFKLV